MAATRPSGWHRRSFLLAACGVAFAPLAFAQARSPLPGGGSVAVPSPFLVKTSYPNHADRVPDALVAYRNWDSTRSGQPDCDCMIAVGLPSRFASLDRFLQQAGAALSTLWGAASEIPGQRWDGKEKHYPIERAEGPEGAERTRRLAVPRVGWFSTYEEPAHLYAVAHRRGLLVAAWVYDKHGGVDGGRLIAAQLVASYQA